MWIDLAVIGVILIAALVGLSKGFLKTILSFASIFVALIISFFLVKPVVAALNGSSVYNFFYEKCLTTLSNFGSLMTTEIPSYESLVATLSTKLPKVIAESLASSIASLIGTSADQTVAQLLTPGLTNIIMNIVVFIGLFVIINIFLLIVKAFVKALTSLPVIKQVDKILGFILGAIIGVLLVYLILLILSLFASNPSLTKFFALLESSKIALPMYNNNLLLLLSKQLLDTGTIDIKNILSPSASSSPSAT